MTDPHADGRDDAAWLAPRVEALPRELPPPEDLWPGIAARLAPRRRPAWHAAAWRLAAALALVATSSAVTWRLARRGAPATPPAAARLEAELRRLDPETRALLDAQLAVLDRALVEARRAAAAAPGDAAAATLVAAVERQRLDLLQQAARLTRL